MRKKTVFPTGQEDGLKLQPLGRMQRHQVDHVLAVIAVAVHDQRDVFKEPGEGFVFLHHADEFFQVIKAACGLGRLVVLPHGRVAGLIKDEFSQFSVRQGIGHGPPAIKLGQQVGERAALGGLELFRLYERSGCLHQRDRLRTRVGVQDVKGCFAKATPWHIDDALELQIV